jgi:hypothetical protein
MKEVRTSHRTTQAVTAYRDQPAGYADDPLPIQAGVTIFAAVADDDTRTLNGKSVKVVRFTLDTLPGWFWLPRSEFVASTVPHDVKTQTGKPFQH